MIHLLLGTLPLILATALPNEGTAAESAFLTDPTARVLLFPRRNCPDDWAVRSGAVSLNSAWERDRSQPWFIELQREGGRWIESGLAHGDKDCVAWGLRQLQWGFKQMNPDGSFDCPDAFHSAGFLVESTSRSLLLIAASPFSSDFTAETGALLPPLLTCARWLASPANFRAAESQRVYTHRRFLLGCGLMQCSLLADQPALRRAALYFIQDGIRLQRHDGAFPEKGGHDSSYHAVAMIYLHRILNITPPADRDPAWSGAADRAATWLLARIDADGRVSTKGNTRTGAGQETTRSGAIKGVNHREIAHALLGHHHRLGQPGLPELATKVINSASP